MQRNTLKTEKLKIENRLKELKETHEAYEMLKTLERDDTDMKLYSAALNNPTIARVPVLKTKFRNFESINKHCLMYDPSPKHISAQSWDLVFVLLTCFDQGFDL